MRSYNRDDMQHLRTHVIYFQICNTFVGPVVQRHDRFLQANFLHPWQIDPVVLLIPMPSWSTDASAILKPFNLNV